MHEDIVLLGADLQPVGSAPKLASHHATTPLHLGFSCYLFNPSGELLITQRAATKKVWPTVWTNSVCGHPMPGETIEAAIERRLAFEIGITSFTNLHVALPDYRYTTPAYNEIIENEFCPVYAAVTVAQPVLNADEVAAYAWVAWPDIAELIVARPDAYSYWFKDQLPKLRQWIPIGSYTSGTGA